MSKSVITIDIDFVLRADILHFKNGNLISSD